MSFQSKLSIAFSLVLLLTIVVALTSWLGMRKALQSQEKLYAYQNHIERIFHEMTLEEQAFTAEETIRQSHLVYAHISDMRQQIASVEKQVDDHAHHEQLSIVLQAIDSHEAAFKRYVQQSLNIKSIQSRMDHEAEKLRGRAETYVSELESGKEIFIAATNAIILQNHYTHTQRPGTGQQFLVMINSFHKMIAALKEKADSDEIKIKLYRIDKAASSYGNTFMLFASHKSIQAAARRELRTAFLELREELSHSITIESQATNRHIELLQSLIIATAILSVILSIVATFVLSDFITRPINQLKKSAQKIVDGDLNTSVTIKAQDEIGELGRLFNNMTEKLRSSFQQLERYRDKLEENVKERTHELELEILERKEAEEDLQESEKRFRTIFDNASDGILVANQETRSFTLANRSICTMLGYTEDELLSLTVDDIHPADKLPHILSEFQLLATGESSLVKDIPVLRKDGSILLTEITGAFLNIGGQRYIMGGFRDITERKIVEEERLKIRKLESVGVLAGGIAHDFNNILAAILGNVSLTLALTSENDKRFELLKELEKASLRARDLTLQLLTFSKGGEPVKELTSVTDIIRESASFILRGSAVRCDFLFADNLWAAEVDAGQISQVIQNIVGNARHAMPSGGIITVKCHNCVPNSTQSESLADSPCIEICITDHGTGIPQQLVEKIFDPYFTTKKKGSGLGLAITHSIIAKHGGNISVSSEEGQGTTFTILLPAVETLLPETQLPLPQKTGGLSGTVMIMDDEQQVRDITAHLLKYIGYTAIRVCDGAEAVKEYKQRLKTEQAVDIIIMDLTIPGGMGGKETAQKILEIDADAKMIVSSGYSQDPIMANYQEFGFQNYLCKPYQIKELQDAIENILHDYRI